MNVIKYLLDENVDPRLGKALRRRSPDIVVWHIGDPGAPVSGMADPDISAWCEARNFILVTNNRASMPIHLKDHLTAARHVPGIFILRDSLTLSESADELSLIWAASDPNEYFHLLRFLPISL